MKKLYIIFSLFLLTIPFTNVSATTIADYRKELEKLQEQKKTQQENSEANKKKIEEAKKELESINLSITTASNDITKTEQEIKELEEEIAKKEEQIKDLVEFLQISNSENFYLKYIFGAESFTDLIYRISVIEQLSTANDNLVDEMNDLIKENEEKIKELEAKKEELTKLNQQVLVQIEKLGEEGQALFDEGLDLDTQMAVLEKQIKYYEDEGCSENQDLSTCNTSVPYDYGYIKPVKHGRITDNYGWRTNPCAVCTAFHKGIDIGGNPGGTPVYAVAAGKVVNVDKYTCGGKVITINHIVNGQYITTRYFHLRETKVTTGTIVTQGQQIGTVGGDQVAYYDSCSDGAHLHFEMIKGHYFGTGKNSYSNYNTYYKNTFDPRDLVWFPAYGVYF